MAADVAAVTNGFLTEIHGHTSAPNARVRDGINRKSIKEKTRQKTLPDSVSLLMPHFPDDDIQIDRVPIENTHNTICRS